jgi:uncharacterized protein
MSRRAELRALERAIATAPSAIVAFSGGVDSSLVAAASARVLGERAVAVTAVSPALATGELDGARSVAAAVGILHRTITTDELSREGYRRNGEDRCYHCKSELYDRLSALGAGEGYAVVFSGANIDDLGDWRPGLRAAAEHDVRHPLVESGFGKSDVRRWASALAIPSADKPAMPCLASRLPYGTPVTRERLAAVEAVEQALRARGFRDVRARHFGPEVRLEVEPARVPELLALADDPALLAAVRAAGFLRLAVQPDGLRSGRLNDVLAFPAGHTP